MSDLVLELRAGLAALFYRNFFRLLLVVTSIAQWAVVAWFTVLAGGLSLPVWGHGLAVASVYALNQAIIARRGRRSSAALRLYSATAFISLFCFAFLVASAGLWGVARWVLGALSAEALTLAGMAPLGAGLDGAFQWLVSLGMVAVALTMVFGYTVGQRQLVVTRLPLALPGKGMRGRPMRIAQVSDIHVGQNLTLPQLCRLVERVNALDADLICVTGDIADSELADNATFFPVLGRLRARFGVLAILGNHDHYAGADRVVVDLKRWTRFRVLRDEAVTLDLDGAPLHVIGLDDRGRDWARGVVSDASLAELLSAAPADIPILLLVHRPDVFRQAAAGGVALTLSGHTHGGQLALPWLGGRRRNLAEIITPFDRGLYRCGQAYLYVNCGLGVTGQRIRLLTPREISVFELEAA